MGKSSSRQTKIPLMLPHSTLDFLFSHICVTRYRFTSFLIFKYCFASRNIMLVFDVRRLIHSSLYLSHKSHFCFLLFQTRHLINFNILLHITGYVMCISALPPADIHFVLASVSSPKSYSVVFLPSTPTTFHPLH